MARAFVVGVAMLVAGCGFKPLERVCPTGDCDGGIIGGGDSGARADGPALDDAALDDASCPSVHVTATAITPTVELLLDVSGSMSENYGGGQISRLQALQQALVDPTTGVVATLADKVVFGATLFSGIAGQPCPLLTTQPRALNNFEPIRSLVANAVPVRDTPTPESIDAVVASFVSAPPAPGSPPFILLATDGLPNICTMPDPTTPAQQDMANNASIDAAKRAFANGIPLFFLFIGNAQAGTHPQQMANAGAGQDVFAGTARVFGADDPASLTEALDTIINGVRSCDLTLDRHVDAAVAGRGVVTLNGTRLVFGVDWTLDAGGFKMRLIEGACTTLKAATTATVDATFPCAAP